MEGIVSYLYISCYTITNRNNKYLYTKSKGIPLLYNSKWFHRIQIGANILCLRSVIEYHMMKKAF
jgi:hypothetical protein